MQFQTTQNFAEGLDQQDPLASFRSKFHIPYNNKGEVIYLCGNSLGLQPKSTREYIETELDAWKIYGVEGHFSGENPWADYHWLFKSTLSKLVGAKPIEVVAMNSLTSNLHLLMVSFYRPSNSRYKILMESGAFPSDQYAIETQVRFHGYKPGDAIIELEPRKGEFTLRTEDILDTIQRNRDSIALIMMSGVQYYTGQLFNINEITRAGIEIGSKVGWDLAHAVGNVPLSLNESGPDFAIWCSYKYLNSGPGGIGGVFIHERHANAPEIPRFAGWWGHKEEERFQMKKGFIPMKGADGWQVSNKNILSLAAQKSSLEIFESAGIEKLREKSLLLTAYLEFLINHELSEQVNMITPEDPEQRGCQLSLIVKEGKKVFNFLAENNVVTDWREPDVIRIAPVPLYNTFMDVYNFVKIIKKANKVS